MVILFCIAAVYRLGSWGVIDTSEARYSEIPRQMYETGDYLHPVYLGIEHYHKPPLTYHITALSYHIFGPDTFGARFPLQVFLVLQLLFVWLIVREIYNDVYKATIGALIYASFFIVWIASRNLTTDAYLCTFLLGAIWAIIVYARRSKPVMLYAAAVLAGLAFLTKITASLVILGPVVLAVWWIYRDTWKWSWQMLPAGLIYLAVGMSWFVLLEQEGKPVLRYLLYDHSVVRYTTDTFGRNNPAYFYLLAAPVLGFPWIIMLFQSVIRHWRARDLRLETGLLLAVWCAFPIVFYSISHSKLILYILPAFAAVAVLTPHQLAVMKPKALRGWLVAQLIFYGLLIIAFLTYPLFSDYVIDLVPQMILVVLLVAMLSVILLHGNLRLPMRMALMSAVFALFAAMIGTHILSANELKHSTAKPVAEWLQSAELDDRHVFILDRLAPSLSFHLQGPTAMIATSEKRELQFEDDDGWQSYYYNLERAEDTRRLQKRLQEPSVLVARRRQEVPAMLQDHFTRETEIGKWRVYY